MNARNQQRQSTRRVRGLATLAAVLSLGLAGAAVAQPFGHHGSGGPHGMIEQIVQSGKLTLDSSQQLARDRAVEASKAAHQQAIANRQSLHAAMQAELAKPEPNLASVAAAADQVQQQNQGLRKSVRDQWLALYAMLTPEQKAVVRDAMTQRMARADSFRNHMRERFHGPGAKG